MWMEVLWLLYFHFILMQGYHGNFLGYKISLFGCYRCVHYIIHQKGRETQKYDQRCWKALESIKKQRLDVCWWFTWKGLCLWMCGWCFHAEEVHIYVFAKQWTSQIHWMNEHPYKGTGSKTKAALSSAERLGTVSRTRWGAMGWVTAGLKASEVNLETDKIQWNLTLPDDLIKEGGLNVGSWTSPCSISSFTVPVTYCAGYMAPWQLMVFFWGDPVWFTFHSSKHYLVYIHCFYSCCSVA